MFDPSKYKITASAEYEVLDAEGNVIYLDEAETKPWTITVASPGTKKAAKAVFDIEQAKTQDLKATVHGRKSKKDENSNNQLRAEFLMKITESTNADNLTYEGKTGLDALRAIYLDPFMAHVAEGVEKFHFNRGNFSADSEMNSQNTSGTSLG